LIAVGSVAFARQEKVIEVRSADVLNVKVVNGEEVRELLGNVHLIQTTPTEVVKIWCDSARRYMDANKVELYGRVRIVRDSVTLFAPEGIFYGDEQRAVVRKGVRLIKGTMQLTAQGGEYFTTDKRAHFEGKVTVVDARSSTLSDALTYFEEDERSIAVGNVRVHDPENNMTIYGDSLLHFDRLKYSLIPKNPKLVQIDTASSGTIDTLVVTSNVMESFRDTSERFIARGEVRMARLDFAGKCGEAIYEMKEDRMILRQGPVIWHGVSQVSGDSIVVTLENKRLRQVYVRGRAMAVSRVDSTLRNRFDQLTGRELTMFFDGEKLQRIVADRNATSLYYLFEDDWPNGVNRSSGDRIEIDFEGGKTEKITIAKGVEGRYYPEPMVSGREPTYNLDGFRWLPKRPSRRGLEIVEVEQ
jgi:lipopolysaccharide export system protein LptA